MPFGDGDRLGCSRRSVDIAAKPGLLACYV